MRLTASMGGHFTLLPDRTILALSGEETRAFLQGLISNNIDRLTPQRSLFAALLTPQGKYLFDFILSQRDDVILIDCEAARAEELAKRLRMYKLRSKVDIQTRPELKIHALWGDTLGKMEGALADPRHASMGFRLIGGGEIPEASPVCLEDYEALRLSLGIPEGIKDFTPERSLLLEFGFDKLNGVDFNKGCYVGQEVTARSKHRASLHKSLFQVEAESPLPEKGTPLFSGEKEIGQICSSVGNKGLAILRHDDLPQDMRVAANGIALSVRHPGWWDQ